MKKTLLFLFSLLLFTACSSRRKTSDSTFMKGFFTYYNTLFNSKDALETELRNRDRAHRDNFYDPYIQLLTYEDQPLGSNIADSAGMFGDDPAPRSGGSGPGIPGGRQNQPLPPGTRSGATILEISEAKALKAIAKYSVLKNGTEKNKKIFDAHILLAQARIYQNKPLEALEALNYIFTNMSKDKRLPLAKIYQGEAYAKMQDFYRAEEVFADLKDKKLDKSQRRLLSLYYAEMLLQAGKKEAAVEELNSAFALNKNRKLRSRIAFLRGQILARLGKGEEARESFVTAYRYSNDFEFEVKSQIEIAKTFNGKDDDYAGAKEYLEKISRKGTYASRKNEFYYALGLMASKAGKREEARQFFAQSLAEKVSDPQIRGLSYFEIGKDYFQQGDYLAAGAYYDSALAVMTYEPSKIVLQEQSQNIKQLSANYYLVKKNDSILALTRMSEAEKTAYFAKYIDALKTKEQQEELARKREERSKGFDTGDYSATSIFAGNTGGFQDFGGAGKGGFYFANSSTVARGESTFRQLWGQRALADNWRTAARSTSIEDIKKEAMGIATVPDPRRLEPSFYIEKIPTAPEEISALKKARDTASLGLGRMYETYFSNTPLATETLYDLAAAQPEEDVKLQALFLIFTYNYEKNPAAAERAKNLILSEFPYTSYAEFVKNPKNASFAQSTPEVEAAYSRAFDLYETEKYEDSKAAIEEAMTKFPKDALIPKFALLNAFNYGKTVGKEIMILQLEQIALNYARTREGEKAAEMLRYLKSDLEIEQMDEAGNRIETAPSSTPENPRQAPQQNGSAPLSPAQPQQPQQPQRGVPDRSTDAPLNENRHRVEALHL